MTEYRYKKPNQTAPFYIEVEYLSKPEIHETIRELLWSYRKLYMLGYEEDEGNEVANKVYRQCEAESEIAQSSLTSAFGDQAKRELERLKNNQTDSIYDGILAKFLDLADEIQWPAGGDNGTWRSEAEDADECNDKTSEFMLDKLWPFTKLIR